MSNEINLAVRVVEVKTHIRRFFLVSILLFGVVFLFSAISIGVNFYFKNKIVSYEQQEAELKSEINQLLPKKSKVMLLQDRIININRVLNTRKQLNEKASFIFSLIPENVTIESMSVTEESATVSLTSTNLFALNEMFDRASNISKESEFLKKVTLNSLAVNQGLEYSLTLLLNFNK